MSEIPSFKPKEELLERISHVLDKRTNLDEKTISTISKSLLTSSTELKTLHELYNISELITMEKGGRGGGISRRLVNVKLNFKKLVTFSAEAILGIVGTLTNPILLVLAGIVLLDKFSSLIEYKYSEEYAAVIWTMWTYRDPTTNLIEHEKIFPLLQGELEKYKMSPMDKRDCYHIIRKLETKYHCIERVKKESIYYWKLKESVESMEIKGTK